MAAVAYQAIQADLIELPLEVSFVLFPLYDKAFR